MKYIHNYLVYKSSIGFPPVFAQYTEILFFVAFLFNVEK